MRVSNLLARAGGGETVDGAIFKCSTGSRLRSRVARRRAHGAAHVVRSELADRARTDRVGHTVLVPVVDAAGRAVDRTVASRSAGGRPDEHSARSCAGRGEMLSRTSAARSRDIVAAVGAHGGGAAGRAELEARVVSCEAVSGVARGGDSRRRARRSARRAADIAVNDRRAVETSRKLARVGRGEAVGTRAGRRGRSGGARARACWAAHLCATGQSRDRARAAGGSV